MQKIWILHRKYVNKIGDILVDKFKFVKISKICTFQLY